MRFVTMRHFNSLRLQVLLSYLGGMILSVTLLLLAAVWVLQDNTLARMDLADAAAGIADDIRYDEKGTPIGFAAKVEDVTWLFDSISRETAYRILDEAGNVVLQSGTGESVWPQSKELLSLARGRFDFEHNGLTMHGATEPIVHNGKIWYLQLTASTRFMELMHRHIAMPLVGAGVTLFSVVSLFAFGLFAYITLRYTLRPLKEISQSASTISPYSLDVRLPVKGVPTELTPLVNSFNQALERLEHGYRVQQEFLATAAHELKTPLALIRAQLELMTETEQRNWLLHDVSYMSRQVQQLLLLAEASERQNYKFIRVNMPQQVTETVAYLQRMADAAQVTLNLELHASDVILEADKGALFTLLKNLLENAIQHAPAGSAVSVDVFSDNITVRDHGPGIEDAQLPKLFDRFWRGAHKRDTGAGLGLTICREIALAHGWVLSAHKIQPGLMFRLQLQASLGVNIGNGNALT
ncbi:signal transduction histidine kinase [Rheinheimera pacifica]|uniref:sensor histidine kinase n=1 Tax=Rheinheimera pacifica TaxID=173990 RepID=UPI0021691599|nr:HAMP domain-containing histidine kinase [Rheinheimera pacifica]MCS4306176.1 signal transduction histidine kinase [Rheinheimera pacifica]